MRDRDRERQGERLSERQREIEKECVRERERKRESEKKSESKSERARPAVITHLCHCCFSFQNMCYTFQYEWSFELRSEEN